MASWFKKLAGLFGSNKPDWKYTTEVIPELGKVDAVYLDGKLLWYDYLKDGVVLEINCEAATDKSVSIKVAREMTKANIDALLEGGVRSIPDDELKVWDFDGGKWNLEKVIINGPGNYVLEIGNTHDLDHCCRVIVENGSYEFECVDG